MLSDAFLSNFNYFIQSSLNIKNTQFNLALTVQVRKYLQVWFRGLLGIFVVTDVVVW